MTSDKISETVAKKRIPSIGKNSLAARKKKIRAVAGILQREYARSCCALHYDTPFQLLVATVLSAQTTDIAVNKATPALFARFTDAHAMAEANEEDIYPYINTIGLWRNKSRFLLGLSRRLVTEFGGELPRTVNELCTLPGVARKTATAVLSEAMGIQAGITVDTHMIRIHSLLGLTTGRDAVKVANEIEAILPAEYWPGYTHRIIDHGRLQCVARRPRCGICCLAAHCDSAASELAGYQPRYDRTEPASAKGLSWLKP